MKLKNKINLCIVVIVGISLTFIYLINRRESKVNYLLKTRIKSQWGQKDSFISKEFEVQIDGENLSCDSCKGFFPFCEGKKLSITKRGDRFIFSLDTSKIIIFDKHAATKIPDLSCENISNLVIKCNYSKDSVIVRKSINYNVAIFSGYYQSSNGYIRYQYYLDNEKSIPLYVKAIIYSWGIDNNIEGTLELIVIDK